MEALIARLLHTFFPWLSQVLFGTAVKKAEKRALKRSPFNFHAPNLLLSILVILCVNIANFLVMFFVREHISPVLVSAGIVTIVTGFFILWGIRDGKDTRERRVLFLILAVFFGLFVFCVVVIDWWWMALIAKLTLEVLLCYAIMLTNKRRIDNAQSRMVTSIIKLLRLRPDGRSARLLSIILPEKKELQEDND